MNSVLALIIGLGLGWWLGPAFTIIAKNIWQEIKDRRYR